MINLRETYVKDPVAKATEVRMEIEKSQREIDKLLLKELGL